LAESGADVKESSTLMETVITFYLKSKNTKYPGDTGYAEVVVPLINSGMSKGDIYNSFYAILNRYIPRDCRPGAPPYHLFRLLLLYHDPGLCSFLDTHKLTPEDYLQPWLRSLFASTCQLDIISPLWDVYFSERDPFLVFFLALVMVINAKEILLESAELDPQQLKELIVSLPKELSSEDIEDFCSLAQYYSSRTPQSFRKDYHTLLFGMSRGSIPSFLPLSHALCLPVSLGEVLDSFQHQDDGMGIRYFVVDSRPVDHFSKGHLQHSFHLDANLFLHSPKDFLVAANRVCERVKRKSGEGGEHLCFLGSGREQEDQFVNMVVAKFLQNGTPYISLAQGGFAELLQLLGDRAETVLEDYDESCKALLHSQVEPKEEKLRHSREATPVTHSDSDSDTSQWGAMVSSLRLQEKGAQLYTSLSTGVRDKSQRLKERFSKFVAERKKVERHVSSHDKPSKRYRNVNADVFSIADDDDDNEYDTRSSSEEESINRMVNIEVYIRGGDVIASFPCNEQREGGYTSPSYLVLSEDHLIVLRECSDRTGWARVKFKHALTSIVKITMKKKHPDVITFKYGRGSGDDVVVTGQQRFQIPQTSKATQAIKTQIEKKVSTL
jgi:hypothetical protein